MAGRGGGGAGSGPAVFLTELEGKNLLDVGALDDGLGNIPHGTAQGGGARQVGRLLNDTNEMNELMSVFKTDVLLPTLPNPATDFLDLSFVLPPDETLSFELSLTGICCLTSDFSPFTSLLVLIKFKFDTEAPEPDIPAFAG